MECTLVQIALEGAAGSFDKLYSYRVPSHLVSKAKAGCRVTVPFGRGDTKRQGIIMGVEAAVPSARIKDIYEVTDQAPVLNQEMLSLCVWMKEHTFCTYFDAVHTMLPAGLNYRFADRFSVDEEFAALHLLQENEQEIYAYLKENPDCPREKLERIFENCEAVLESLEEKQAVIRGSHIVRRMGDKTAKWVRSLCESDELPAGLTARQKEIAQLVTELQSISVKELQYFTGVTQSVIDALIKKGVLASFEKEEFRTPYRNTAPPQRKPIIFTEQQQKAYDGLKQLLDQAQPHAALLYGVTGSGKTQVFLSLVDNAVDMGRGVIIMVPEIALTPQMIGIFSSRYGDKIAVFHSAMSQGQRMDEYKRIRSGKALIAIGTRSAVFAPFEDLALIVMDEEQEHTYKSEKSPRFHARDIAKFRVNYHSALLCMASATPSLESYSAALRGKYSLFCMPERYGSAVLPQVTTVDMKKELLSGNSGSISGELFSAVDGVLKNGKQAIILLNRRGRNTYITCPSCGYVASCPNCSVSLTYHSANHRLMCHYCGYSEAESKVCPQCNNENIRFLGVGTQKVEEELKALFPEARIVRMDADSTMTRESYSKNLTAFANGEYDIMLGTQMVAKGLDFPNVTLVGVIGADQAAYSEDYRSFEKSFSLLTQVIGRAGRGTSEGIAVIQTLDPASNIISLACRQDYEAFYEEEIKSRKVMIFPPYCDICVIWSQSTDRTLAEATVREVFDRLREGTKGEFCDVRLMILGPAAAAMPKVNNRYRYRLTIKCKNDRRFRELLRKAIDIRLKKDASVTVDINPESVI